MPSYEYKKVALQEDIKLTTTEIENGVDITDSNGNTLIELQNGNIKVANFDSAQLDNLVSAIVTLMQGRGVTISNNQINSNILYDSYLD